MAKHSHARRIDPAATPPVTPPAALGAVQGAASGVLDLDRVIHERVRLAIVSALAVNPSLSFSELKHLLDTTDGNLSVHARKLEDAGYVRCSKSFEGRTPRSDYELTSSGRHALHHYLSHMEALIRATKKA